MNIAILGNGQPVLMLLSALNNNNKKIKIIGVESENRMELQEERDFKKELEQYKINLYKDITNCKDKIDLIVVINYNKIIDLKRFAEQTQLINIHMGLLPKYRGNNANAWAIMNGEKYVGYTIHKIEQELDSGPIFYRFKHDIRHDFTYIDAKKAINNDIKSNIWTIITKIYKKSLKPISQKGSKFTYCTKLKPEDGIIKTWDVPSSLLIQKHYVFGKPLGSGLKFIYKNAYYEIGELSSIKEYEESIGVPGAIVYSNKQSIWVKTKDTAVSLSKIVTHGGEIDVKNHFKIGIRL